MNAQYSSQSSRCIFVTSGILLRWLSSDSSQDQGEVSNQFSHLILDEVHERDRYSDFLLILLKHFILPRNPNLRLILMSATIQTQDFISYFSHVNPPHLTIDGRTFDVVPVYLEQLLQLLQFDEPEGNDLESESDESNDESSAFKSLESEDQFYEWTCLRCASVFTGPVDYGVHVATCTLDVPGHHYPDPTTTTQGLGVLDELQVDPQQPPNPNNTTRRRLNRAQYMSRQLKLQNEDVKDDILASYFHSCGKNLMELSADVNLIVDLLFYIDERAAEMGSGGVLIFLSGWDEICALRDLLRQSSPFDDTRAYLILPLHSCVSSADQRKVFQPTAGRLY